MSDIEPISIPDARKLLIRYAIEWDRPELQQLAARMVRRKPKYPIARPERKSLCPKLAIMIREYKNRHPRKSNRDIGRHFGVDGGRVSEAIHSVKGY